MSCCFDSAFDLFWCKLRFQRWSWQAGRAFYTEVCADYFRRGYAGANSIWRWSRVLLRYFLFDLFCFFPLTEAAELHALRHETANLKDELRVTKRKLSEARYSYRKDLVLIIFSWQVEAENQAGCSIFSRLLEFIFFCLTLFIWAGSYWPDGRRFEQARWRRDPRRGRARSGEAIGGNLSCHQMCVHLDSLHLTKDEMMRDYKKKDDEGVWVKAGLFFVLFFLFFLLARRAPGQMWRRLRSISTAPCVGLGILEIDDEKMWLTLSQKIMMYVCYYVVILWKESPVDVLQRLAGEADAIFNGLVPKTSRQLCALKNVCQTFFGS